jgi:hypothetical protein
MPWKHPLNELLKQIRETWKEANDNVMRAKGYVWSMRLNGSLKRQLFNRSRKHAKNLWRVFGRVQMPNSIEGRRYSRPNTTPGAAVTYQTGARWISAYVVS